MDSVTSGDGTQIAFERRGDGPPLVLVHGTAIDHHVWDRVSPDLAEQFTVYAMDRRGRGESGDADDYAIEREFEDVVAVAAAADGPVTLLGHSYGAVCAIGAAPRVSGLEQLVLYEPPLWVEGRTRVPGSVIDRMEAAADRDGQAANERILELFFEEVAESPERLEAIRSSPNYDRHVAAAAKLPRELRGREGYRPTPDSYPTVSVPTTLLLGTESPKALARSTEAAADLFPDSRIERLPGQGHGAMYTAPDLLTATLTSVLDGGSEA